MPSLPKLLRGKAVAIALLCLAVVASALRAPSAIAQTEPQPTPTPSPAPAAAPADMLSFVSDTLPERKRDLYVMRLDGTDKKQLTNGFNVWFASWSPDGARLAVTAEDSRLFTLKADGSDLKEIASGAYSPPYWSPDGHFIAYVGGEKFGTPVARGNLRIVPAGGGEPWLVPGGEDIPSLPPGAAAAVWSPDGTRMAVGWPARILHVADGPDVKVEPLPGPKRDWFVVAGGWAPDGKHLAVTDGRDYGVLDLSTGEFVAVARSQPQPGMARPGVSWSAGIGKVAFAINSTASDGNRLFLADLDGGNAKVILQHPRKSPWRGEVSDYGPPFFSSDSKTMLLRVSRATSTGGVIVYTHESWLVRTDGSGGEKLLDGFNANWQPKTRLKLTDSAFWFQWRVPDLAVANGQASRSWLWGPTAIYSGTEPLAEAPGGQQAVVYFDKGRMDLPNPNPPRPSRYVVVAGALARELATGQISTGATSVETRQPAEIEVAGDPGSPNAPTYATLGRLAAGAEDKTGQPVEATLARDGTVGANSALGAGVKAGAYSPQTGHNIPDVFMAYFRAQTWDWIYVAGYPITEAYWTHVNVAGQERDVLVQLFERRSLTFDPAAPEAYRVQFGNVGRHYFDWRYAR